MESGGGIGLRPAYGSTTRGEESNLAFDVAETFTTIPSRS